MTFVNDTHCTSRSKAFYIGASVHLPGQCDVWAEITAVGNKPLWWQAQRKDNQYTTCWFGVNENTGHVLCGGEGSDWIIEKFERSFLTSMIGDPGDRWVRIMHPRPLEYTIPWCKRKHDEGLTVRMRNLRTGEIIPGDAL